MVAVGEKNYKHIDEGPIRRVRFARSPTANAEDNSTSEDEDNGMRVGPEYQANIPDFVQGANPETKHEAMLVWSPDYDGSLDSKIDEYANDAKEKHGYNTEQALGMLFWHKHHIEKALQDLSNFTPFPDEWNAEDKVLFEQAFSFHGKTFHRIRMMLPDKTVGSLVKYYYSWKKTRSRTSLIDRQAHKISHSHDISEDEVESNIQSETESENSKDKQQKDDTKNGIGKAGFGSRKILHDPKMRNKKKPPRGMHLNKDSLMKFVAGAPNQADLIIKQLELELVNFKKKVQNNKQMVSSLKEKIANGLSSLKLPEYSTKPNGRWTNEELLLAVQGVRKYGKDFKAIAEIIGNKSETLVRSFFVNYRRRYNLDEVYAEFEQEQEKLKNNKLVKDNKEVPMEVDVIINNISKPQITTLASGQININLVSNLSSLSQPHSITQSSFLSSRPTVATTSISNSVDDGVQCAIISKSMECENLIINEPLPLVSNNSSHIKNG